MKITKEKYPFTVTIEDKISQSTGKMYQAISIKFVSKAKDYSETNKNYDKTFFNFFDEADLLALSSLCEAAYQHLAITRQKEKEELYQSRQQ